MKAVVLYTLLWAITAAVTWRCWTKWRRSADQLWPTKWDALSWALLLLGLSTGATLQLLNVAPAITNSVVLILLVAAAASTIAKPISTRRADGATRAMRSGLGLPVERRMWRPATIGALWCMGAFLLFSVWFFAVSGDKRQPEMDQSRDTGFMIAFGVVVLGLVHAGVQEARVGREQRRVRAAEHDYLAQGTPESGPPQ
ncbi:hypothetical protein J7F03_40560 [Streptomyces sp. ISL-43]|uniref:hypothetical protein n=1 Tax=Streptomyces sp. ISL-43 TaxID=2819183 RepID=UPI001BE95446|nr:hypothetical protein [Streptomyces sp. ISL-43]MBT2453197.1 hypothetical protein [Streptomyces sp. ISL-43]